MLHTMTCLISVMLTSVTVVLSSRPEGPRLPGARRLEPLGSAELVVRIMCRLGIQLSHDSGVSSSRGHPTTQGRSLFRFPKSRSSKPLPGPMRWRMAWAAVSETLQRFPDETVGLLPHAGGL